MSNGYLAIIGFLPSYALIYHWEHTYDTGPTSSISRDGGKPRQLVLICSRIHVQYNIQVGCYLLHSDMNLTIYSPGLPPSFRNHLLLLFHTTKCWIHNHLSQVVTDLKHADRRVLHPICHTLAHSTNAVTT